MISIIISSAQKHLLHEVSKNIEVTIGTPYELIAIDNSNGAMGICEVYNQGARRAKYDVLCFMHEDIDIKTINWGDVVLRIFRDDPLIGIVGAAGSAYKSLAPSGWATISQTPNTVYCNYFQGFKRTVREPVHFYSNPKDLDIADVVCVDGMWFCTLRQLALKYPFDERLLKGFHCYDIDYCLSIKTHYKVVVAIDILIAHFSEGGYNEAWFNDTLKIHDKWMSKLPISVDNYEPSVQAHLEKGAYKLLLQQLVAMDYPIKKIMFFLRKSWAEGRIRNKMYFKLMFYAIKFYVKKHKS
jgi:hypothetical protein